MAEALPEGGGLLVAEALLNEGGVGAGFSEHESVNMLVCADWKERACASTAVIRKEAGLCGWTAGRRAAPLDAVLTRK